MKACSKCGRELPSTTEFFSNSKGTKDGFHSRCKECNNAEIKVWRAANRERVEETTRAWRTANQEKVRASHRAWLEANPKNEEERNREAEYRRAYQEANRERIAEYKSAWREANRGKVTERDKAWREANRERKRETDRAWKEANRERRRATKHRRRAIKLNAPGAYTLADIQERLEEQAWMCVYCHEPLEADYHVDHIVPLIRGGDNGPENLAIACPTCNLSKGSKLLAEWKGSYRAATI
jgi:5-methylcytosine-specific restriction endonuclease McrA